MDGVAFSCGAMVCLLAASLRVVAGGPRNEHAWWLDREAMVADRVTGEWMPCVVVAVSWKGSLRVRRISDGRGFWVDRTEVGDRVMPA